MSGLGDKLMGSAKEAAGKVTGNDELEAKGKAQQISGDVKNRVEDMKDDAGDKINDALDSIKDKSDTSDESE